MTNEQFARHIPRLRRLSTEDPVVAELAQDMAHTAARLDLAIEQVTQLANAVGDYMQTHPENRTMIEGHRIELLYRVRNVLGDLVHSWPK